MAQQHPNRAKYSQVHILSVDEDSYASSILRSVGHAVTQVFSGQQALSLLQQVPIDLMILEMHLPDMDGVELMRKATQLTPNLIVIILTAHATLENAIAAVKLNAVDYLRKPASSIQIMQSINRALRCQFPHLRPPHSAHTVTDVTDTLNQREMPASAKAASPFLSERYVCVPPVTLDFQKRRALVDDYPQPRSAQLTEGEMDVLTSLVAHPNQVLSCSALVSKAWGYTINEEEAKSLIRPYIFRLRRKLEANRKEPLLIRTIRNRGYLFSGAAGQRKNSVAANHYSLISA